MWHCEKCSTSVESGTICPACGRPLDAAVAAIGRKVRQVRFLSNVNRRWAQRGAVIGFITAIILAPALAALLVCRFVSSTDGALPPTDSFVQLLAIFLALPIFLPLFFGCIAFVLAAVVRPLCIALFCSIERFEQEYGSTKQ